MRVLIIEDEHYAREKLQAMLQRLDNSIEVAGRAASVEEAVALIRNTPDIDLAFFDIQLADALSFSIFDRVEFDFPVIFTTAYDRHAIRAFKHNSVDYLLKPIRNEELAMALEKYHRLWRPKAESLQSLRKQIRNPERNSLAKERFTVKVGEHIKMIKTEGVSCFYSFNKGTFMQTRDDRNFLIDYSLDDLSELLDSRVFFRVNRKFMVNINFIDDMLSYSNSRLKVKMRPPAHEEIIVSRERVKDFRAWLER